MGARIAAHRWGFGYPGRSVAALSEVSFTIGGGDLVVLMGASGSGKSTLLAALAGTLPEGGDSGSLVVEHPGTPGSAVRIGLVQQEPEGNIVMERVGDDVAFPLENAAFPAPQIWPEVVRALAQVGLSVSLDRDTSRLSGGQQQLLAVAAASVAGPHLLLLDEPTANLDPAGAAAVLAAVEEIRMSHGCTVVVVEHRVEAWLERADRVLLVEDGSVLQLEPADLRGHLAARPDSGARVWVDHASLPSRAPRVPPGRLVMSAQAVGVTGRLPPTDLEVRAQDIVAVTGPPGSGKSTLLACLAGLLEPSAGSVRVPAVVDGGRTERLEQAEWPERTERSEHPEHPEGTGSPARSERQERVGRAEWSERTDPWRWPSAEIARTFGVVFQNPEHQFVTGRVADEVHHGLVGAGVEEPEASQRTAAMLDRLHLDHLAAADPFTLSGGEQRRLSVGTALALDPGILLLDEPTFGQDPATWAELVGIIADHRDAGGAVVMATHDPDLVHALGAREVHLAALHPRGTWVRVAALSARTFQDLGRGGRKRGRRQVRVRRGQARMRTVHVTGRRVRRRQARAGRRGRARHRTSGLGAPTTCPLRSDCGASIRWRCWVRRSCSASPRSLSTSVALNLLLALAAVLAALVGGLPIRRVALLAAPALLAAASVAFSNALLSASGLLSPSSWAAAALPASSRAGGGPARAGRGRGDGPDGAGGLAGRPPACPRPAGVLGAGRTAAASPARRRVGGPGQGEPSTGSRRLGDPGAVGPVLLDDLPPAGGRTPPRRSPGRRAGRPRPASRTVCARSPVRCAGPGSTRRP